MPIGHYDRFVPSVSTPGVVPAVIQGYIEDIKDHYLRSLGFIKIKFNMLFINCLRIKFNNI